MNIIKQVKSLNLPSGKFIVVGSGIMSMHGLKETHDIDLVVSPEIFEEYKNAGWEVQHYTYLSKLGKIYLKKGDMELYTDVNYGNFNPTLEELLSRAEFFEDIPFVCFEDLLKFKTEYDRPKDQKDIEVIKVYLKTKASQRRLT